MNGRIRDLHRLEEDKRIELIGAQARTQVVGVMIDDEPAKIERYKRKLAERFPETTFIDETPTVVRGVAALRFGPRKPS